QRDFVTYGIAVNGYSEKRDMANSFAAYLADQGAAKMYARTGHIPARLGVEYEQTGMEGFLEEYSKSIPIPKLMSMANFWVRMEIAYTKIWSGEDVSEILRNLSEQVMTQVTGEDYTETEYIELPTETETQFLDEGMD
ncbi:MAG: sugar ABC transporter substrate-binding protein, partial [Lachnospiraceae bacterium]|nr:sugar ABC transporter substrate-binding protein [Lachnospiraceae bacterium]